MQQMTVTQHNREEWRRCADDCQKHGRIDKANMFRTIAERDSVSIRVYDRAMEYYRNWLLYGFPK